MKTKKVCITSLGCVRNLVDSEVMIGYLLQEGFAITLDIAEADVHIINTCGFLQEAREEGLEKIAEIFAGKKAKAKVIVTGCMVSLHLDLLKKHFSDVHYYLGAGDVDQIIPAIHAPQKGEKISQKSFLETCNTPRAISTPLHYAYVKISEGCKKLCSYCLIPKIKGPLRSKSFDQILKEIQFLLDQGVFEIILVAQDLGDFGKDFGQKNALCVLLKEILKIKKDFWIRLLYIYPDEISDELMAIMKLDPRICPYLDMPIQHISDDILKAMRRKTTQSHILNILDKLRENIPHIVLRTTLMTGFPGESKRHFDELLQFIEKYRFDHIGVFGFSPEEGTDASRLSHQLTQDVIQTRLKKLMQTQKKIVAKKNRALIGTTLDIIVDGYYPHSDNLLIQGRYYGQCPEVDSIVIINDIQKIDKIGQKIQVQITDVVEYDFLGKQV